MDFSLITITMEAMANRCESHGGLMGDGRWLRRLRSYAIKVVERGGGWWRMMADSGSTWSDRAACPGAVFGVACSVGISGRW